MKCLIQGTGDGQHRASFIWYWTGAEFQGPTTLRVDPPLDVMPLYVGSDAIVPMWPEKSYVGEKFALQS